MTSGRIALAVVSLGAVALSAAQLWSLWRTGQPIFRRQRGRARMNQAFAFVLDVVSNTLVLLASGALLVWALAG
jgi:hypothetical protein